MKLRKSTAARVPAVGRKKKEKKNKKGKDRDCVEKVDIRFLHIRPM